MIAYSTDGEEWETVTHNFNSSERITTLAFGADRFVATVGSEIWYCGIE
jgi:hypothetical protein